MSREEYEGHGANDSICRAATELYGDRMEMTDPVVPECKNDPVFMPSTQTEADTREWCLAHRT